MAEYKVTLKTDAFAYIRVEADSEEEAGDLAARQAPSFCAPCGGWDEDWSLELNDEWETEEVEETTTDG